MIIRYANLFILISYHHILVIQCKFFKNALNYWRGGFDGCNVNTVVAYLPEEEYEGGYCLFDLNKINGKFSSMKVKKEIPVIVRNE